MDNWYGSVVAAQAALSYAVRCVRSGVTDPRSLEICWRKVRSIAAAVSPLYDVACAVNWLAAESSFGTVAPPSFCTPLRMAIARNSLARVVFFYRLGEIRDRSYENQRYRPGGGNLVVAAITLWKTVYLERSIAALRQQREIDNRLISHVAPLGWNDVNLTGDYGWHANKRVAKGRYHPLRVRRSRGTRWRTKQSKS
jgi:hypothetical protein